MNSLLSTNAGQHKSPLGMQPSAQAGHAKPGRWTRGDHAQKACAQRHCCLRCFDYPTLTVIFNNEEEVLS
jgi:hypothetical protein